MPRQRNGRVVSRRGSRAVVLLLFLNAAIGRRSSSQDWAPRANGVKLQSIGEAGPSGARDRSALRHSGEALATLFLGARVADAEGVFLPLNALGLHNAPRRRNSRKLEASQEGHELEVAARLREVLRIRGGDSSQETSYASEDVGEFGTLEFRNFLTVDGKDGVSFWHDIPLRAEGKTYNVVIEIPRQTKAKMEMSTTEPYSPIKQDVKKGKLRDYNMPIEWNYGAFPQTWEQPDHVWDGLEGHSGDNDPVDVVDLSTIRVETGSVIQVKVIGALAMIDEGEVDWKVLVINVADPLAERINSLEDCEELLPGQVSAVRDWFAWYKALDETGARIPDKEPNFFGFGGEALDTEKAVQVIAEAHASWKALISKKVSAGDLSLKRRKRNFWR